MLFLTEDLQAAGNNDISSAGFTITVNEPVQEYSCKQEERFAKQGVVDVTVTAPDGTTLAKNVDYKVSSIWYKVGTQKFKVYGKGSYTGTVECEVTIVPQQIARDQIVLNYDEFYYTGGIRRPNVLIQNKEHAYLLSDSPQDAKYMGVMKKTCDYKITFTNDINPGKASIHIEFCNGYAGTYDITYLIKDTYLNVTPTGSTSTTDNKIKLGDYVILGRYGRTPILWRCVNIDENGPLMLADTVLTYKPFDSSVHKTNARGSHMRDTEFNSTNTRFDKVNGNRANESEYGASNYWPDSNLRCWLNSSASAGKVQFLCGTKPDRYGSLDKATGDSSNMNGYSKEAGFLTRFTKEELQSVKAVTQKCSVAYNEYYYGIYTSGSNYNLTKSPFIFLKGGTVDDVFGKQLTIDNFDTKKNNLIAEDITDKFFCLDPAQLLAVYKNEKILGEYYATTKDFMTQRYFDADTDYWLRTPSHALGYMTQVASIDSLFGTGQCVWATWSDAGSMGVRPAFYLDSSVDIFSNGDGSLINPYHVVSALNKDSATAKLKDGWYNITMKNTYFHVATNGNLKFHENSREKFYLTNVGYNHYTITTKDKKYVGVNTERTSARIKVTDKKYIWYISPEGSDTSGNRKYSLRSSNDYSYCAHAKDSSAKNNNNVIMWPVSSLGNLTDNTTVRLISCKKTSADSSSKITESDKSGTKAATIQSLTYSGSNVYIVMENAPTDLGAAGYQVSYRDTNDKKWTTVTVKKQHGKLGKYKENTSYIAKVRSYTKKDGKTIYGDWSELAYSKFLY